ncbi:MAG: hypothetical protein AB7O88_24745 [Reyranellaceae bacterium]
MRALPALACLAAWLGSGPTLAQTAADTVWEAPRSGRWTVKAIRVGPDGPAQCLMSNIGQGSGVAYAIAPGEVQRLVLQNAQWRIPAGTQAAIHLQVDRHGVWEVTAKRSPTASDTIFVDARFDADARRLLEQIRQGKWLHIVFPSGEHYQVSLEGSRLAARYLLECHARYGKASF